MEKNKNGMKIFIAALLCIIIVLLVIIIVLFLDNEREYDDDYPNYGSQIYDQGNNSNSNNNNEENNNGNNNNGNNNDNGNYISKQNALSIALKNIGLKESDIYDLSIELDYKYGKVVYEIDFDYKQYEYEFYIDATSGAILHSFKERS